MSKRRSISFKIKEKWKPHLVFAIFAFLLYGNTLNHFYALDDVMVITNNRFTQQGIKGIPDIFKYDSFVGDFLSLYDEDVSADQLNRELNYNVGGRYMPLLLVTFALEVEFWGKEILYPNSNNKLRITGNPFVSHLNNLILYLFTTCLLYVILCRLFPFDKDKKWYLSLSFISTLLFLAHPVHTEVVANIKSRNEIMALLGSLGALWFTIKFFDTNKYRHLALSGLCLFGGLLSKENTITFVAVIPVTLYYFISREKGLIAKSMIPLLIVTALFIAIRTTVIGQIDSSKMSVDILNNAFIYTTTGESTATVFYTLLLYIKLLFFPHPLTYDYHLHHIEIVNWSNPVSIVSLLFYVGIGIYAVYGLVKKRNIISWSIWLYLLPLSIVSNLFFPLGGALMAERFVFFSSLGFTAFLGWLIVTCAPKIHFSSPSEGGRSNSKITRYFTGAVAVTILCLYAAKTISRNSVWKDNFTLLTTDVRTSKNSAAGNNAAGSQYLQKAIYPDNHNEAQLRNDYCDEAAQYFKRALQLFPHHVDATINLGNLYFDCYKDVAQSLHYFAMVIPYNTIRTNTVIHSSKQVLNATLTLLDEKQINSTPEEIIRSCDELLIVQPNIGEAFYVKGVIYGKYLNNFELALINLEQALSMDFPKTANFYEYLGVAYGFSGNLSNSIQYLLKAIELGSEDYNTYINLGVIYRQLGDMDNANLYTSKGNEMKERADSN